MAELMVEGRKRKRLRDRRRELSRNTQNESWVSGMKSKLIASVCPGVEKKYCSDSGMADPY